MTLKLGDLVNVRGHAKGEHRVHIVVEEQPHPGRVGVSLCGERWFSPQRYAVEFVSLAPEDSKETKRVRRMLARVKPDPDGWTRICVGKGYKQSTPQMMKIKPPSW